MDYRIAADAVLVLHLAFIVFAAVGGLLALRWRWAPLLHLPAMGWGLWVEATGGLCPLTALENALRGHAGRAGYSGGFIEHYLLPIIYPAGLAASVQLLMAIGLVAINVVIYSIVIARRARRADW